MSNENPNTPSSPSCGTRARALSYGPARACFCRPPTASKQSPTTMEKSSPLTSRSQPRWGRYPILPNPITRGNAASTNTPTACSDSTSQKVQICLLCPIPMSKGSRINSTLAPERYSATELLVRFSSTPKISPLHFAVEWAALLDEAEGAAIPPRDGDGFVDEAGGEDDGQVGATVEAHCDLGFGDGDIGWHVDEVAEDLAG